MFEDPELQDPSTLSINENYDNQALSHLHRRKASATSDYGSEAPHIRVVIKEEEDGWTVRDSKSYYFGVDIGDTSAQTWRPNFKAHGKQSCDSYTVKGQQRVNIAEKYWQESGDHVAGGPSPSAREGQQRPEISGYLTVDECSNTGEKSPTCPGRETTHEHKTNVGVRQRSQPEDGGRHLKQNTSLPKDTEPQETETPALSQTDSSECKSTATHGYKMASADLEGQTLRLTVRLQAAEAEEEEEQDEEIGGFINSDGEVVEWDASLDRGSDGRESPQHSKGVGLSKPHFQGQTQRDSSPMLIMEVDDVREEEEEKDRVTKMATISPLNRASADKRKRDKRRKNKAVSEAQEQAPANPERRSRRKISGIPPSYEGLDAEPELSRRFRRKKKVAESESKPKSVRRLTDSTKQASRTYTRKKETKQRAEEGEISDVPVVKKPPGRKRLRVPVEIPPELLKKPKEKIVYQCSVCGKEFPHAYKLERHELIHTGEKPYCCSICGRGFNQKGNLKTHYKVHYGQKGVPDFEDEPAPIAPDLSEYLKSLPGESKIRSSLHCLECGKDCESQSALQAHHITAHTPPAPESDPIQLNVSQPHICHHCDIQFKEKEKLDEHMKTHNKEKRFSCPDCGKKFINESYIHVHQRIHTGERPYLCSQCGRGFHTASALKIHEMQHSEERPFACSICGKSFRLNSYLIAHYQTHTIDRPFICSLCGKAYSRIDELKVHQRIHTGERPFECSVCGKSFIYRQGLRQHQRTHAGRRIGPTRQLGRPKQQARLDI